MARRINFILSDWGIYSLDRSQVQDWVPAPYGSIFGSVRRHRDVIKGVPFGFCDDVMSLLILGLCKLYIVY